MGFDAVATSAEECKNPSRDLPIGIISSIAICMALYIAVSLALTAAVNYTQLDTPEPVAYALRSSAGLILPTSSQSASWPVSLRP